VSSNLDSTYGTARMPGAGVPRLLLSEQVALHFSAESYPHEAGEQYGNIDGAKIAQLIPIGPNLLLL